MWHVRWCSAAFDYHLTVRPAEGVRQAGLLSLFLFDLCLDDMSEQLNACHTGCAVINLTIVRGNMLKDVLFYFLIVVLIFNI